MNAAELMGLPIPSFDVGAERQEIINTLRKKPNA